jgi:tRNA-2-methylthio-N6-dimethylallyladenosine synthase
LLALGVKEITLLGQNVSSYEATGPDGKKWNLARLLFELADLDDLKRIRYITSNPKDIDVSLAEAHRKIDILAPFLHLPVQSGSDGILKKMNRKYSVAEYVKCLDMLRDARPDMAFSSDFIVGFPGETEEDFEKTIKLAEKIRFAQAYSFKYSPRPNTAAAKMDNQVPDEIKSKRLQRLQALLNEHQHQFNVGTMGKTLSVLLTKDGKHKNQLTGRSEYSQAVSVCDNCIRIGDMVRVKITEVKAHSLFGSIEE